jgi:hypothetical protein
VEVIACSPENSAVMHHSIRAGRILEMESKPTLSDGTAGAVEQGAITLDLCRRFVDRYLLISEDEIVSAGCQAMELIPRMVRRRSSGGSMKVMPMPTLPVATHSTEPDRAHTTWPRSRKVVEGNVSSRLRTVPGAKTRAAPTMMPVRETLREYPI